MMNENELKKRNLALAIIVQDVKHWLFIILCFTFSISYIFFAIRLQFNKEIFRVSATFVISSNITNDSLKNLSKAQEVSSVFSRILERDEIKDIILQNIEESDLEDEIKSELIEETSLIKITVSSVELRRAYLILESILAIKEVFLDYISDDVEMELLVSPEIAKRDFGILKILKETIIVFILIFIGLISIICIYSYLKDTIKLSSDIEDILGTKCIGIIPKEKDYSFFIKKKNLLISRPSISFQYVESINRLCRKIKNKMEEDESSKILMVTSSVENEGKSTIAANIAYSLYTTGKNVLIIDLDLMNPSLYKIFNVTEKLETFQNFLYGKPVKRLVRNLEEDGLSSILNTEKIGDTIDLVNSSRLKKLLESLKKSFDYIIIDCPPINNIVDSEVVADLADVSILVIKQNYIRTDLITDSISVLNNSKSTLLGCVLNDAVIYSELGGYDYYNKYRTGYYSYYKDEYYKRDI